MNAERLHAIVLALKDEVQETATHLLELSQALKRQQAQPADGNAQKQVADSRSKTNRFLSQSATNKFSPVWRESLAACNVDHLLGEKLRITIEEIFTRNEITPAAAYDEVKRFSDSLNKFSEANDGIINGFSFYEIGAEQLQAGECEVGFLIPRKAVHNHLNELGEEFKELNEILLPFAELATGGRPHFVVRSISSTDFGVFLHSAPGVAACIAAAAERIIAAYKSLLEIRTLRSGLAKEGLAKDALEGVDAHAEKVMKNAIGPMVNELVKEYGGHVDPHRINELKTELTKSANAIANRIDRGYNIEIRAVPPPAEDAGDGEASEENPDGKAEYFATIGAAQENLKFIHQDGTPMLCLPTSDEVPAAEPVGPVAVPAEQTTRNVGKSPKTPKRPARKRR